MNLAHDERVNWVRVITDLRQSGYGDQHIAVHIGVQRDKVRKWRETHGQPRHDDGERLIAMWAEKMRKSALQVHIVSHAEDYEEIPPGQIDPAARVLAILDELRKIRSQYETSSTERKALNEACDRLDVAVSVLA